MTWSQIVRADRHGLGLETIPANQIRPSVPSSFADAQKFLVLRYDENLPMVGSRVKETFHVLWIEANYGDVYDHGS